METMPAYPDARPIAWGDREAFDRAFSVSPPEISEFTFTNLFAWRQAYRFLVCRTKEAILLRSDGLPARPLFCPIGTDHPEDEMRRVAALEPGAFFVRIGEAIAKSFDGDPRFRVSPDRDNADYLYRVHDLVALEGKRFDGKRNLIRRFKADQRWRYVVLDASCAGLCLDFEEYWCGLKDCDHVPNLDAERAGLRDMTAHFGDLGLVGGAIEVSGSVRSIAVAQRLNGDTLVVHVLKADPNIPGLYQATMHELLARQAADFTYVNLEQDLGIEGLRRSKESYHPFRLVMKYTVSAVG